jgi:hypothetical protein
MKGLMLHFFLLPYGISKVDGEDNNGSKEKFVFSQVFLGFMAPRKVMGLSNSMSVIVLGSLSTIAIINFISLE